jgi:hypothetical protein
LADVHVSTAIVATGSACFQLPLLGQTNSDDRIYLKIVRENLPPGKRQRGTARGIGGVQLQRGWGRQENRGSAPRSRCWTGALIAG